MLGRACATLIFLSHKAQIDDWIDQYMVTEICFNCWNCTKQQQKIFETNQYGHIRKQKNGKVIGDDCGETHTGIPKRKKKKKSHSQTCFSVVSLSSPEKNSNHKWRRLVAIFE